MKKSFKNLLATAVVLLLALVLVAFVACNGKDPLEEKLNDLQNKLNGIEATTTEKDVTLYIGEKQFDVTTRLSFVHELLKQLFSEGKISAYTYSGSDLNAFASQIDDLDQNFSEGKYYSVWHNVDNDSLKAVYDEAWHPSRAFKKQGEFASFSATEFKGKELFYSNVGVSILPLVDGCVYAILID